MSDTQTPPPLIQPDNNPKKSKRPIGLLLTFLLPYALLMSCSLFVGVVAGLIGGAFTLKVAVAVIQLIAIIIPTLWLFHYYNRSVIETTAPQIPKLGPMAGLLVFLGGFIVLMDTLMYYAIELLPPFISEPFQALLEEQGRMMEIYTVSDGVWYLLVVVLGAGIFEELLFRGLILKALCRYLPALPAICLNGIFFALMHNSVLAFTYYFTLGALLAYVALRTGTLIYGMVLHCVLNFSALIFFQIFGPLVRFPVPAWVAIFGGLALIVFGLIVFSKTEHRRLVSLAIKPKPANSSSLTGS